VRVGEFIFFYIFSMKKILGLDLGADSNGSD
jgi:hypothetical protein